MILIRTHRGVPPVPNNDQRAKAFDRATSRARCVSETFAYQRLLHRQEAKNNEARK